jgi:hypothetical protein
MNKRRNGFGENKTATMDGWIGFILVGWTFLFLLCKFFNIFLFHLNIPFSIGLRILDLIRKA